LIFAGEAYNVEQGVTNEAFPNSRGEAGVEDPPECQLKPNPEDFTHLSVENPDPNPAVLASQFSSDLVNFAGFMRLGAPPAQVNPTDPSVAHGERVFAGIGCNGCHARTQTTGASIYSNQSNVTYVARSDFAIPHMGRTL